MTPVSGCALQLKGALLSVFNPTGAAGSLKYSIRINKWPAEYAISSNLASALRTSGCNDDCNTRRFLAPSIRFSSSDAAGQAGELFEFLDDDDNTFYDNTVEASRRKAYWDRMFDDLKSYVAVNGDALVPRTYPDNQQLGSWVDNQRQVYRRRSEAVDFGGKKRNNSGGNKCNTHDDADERVKKLNSIGFVWNLYDHSWNMRYEELKEYVAENGDSLVPWNYAKNESLGLWVVKQRRNFKVGLLKVDSGEAILSKERIDKLNEIGFVWDVHEAQWLERLQDLRVYKKIHGDTLVPKIYPANNLLGRWVNTQRLDYTRYLKMKEFQEKWRDIEVMDDKVREEMERLMRRRTGMTEKRVQLLDSEGFIWDAHAHVWESQFQELCNFVALNGHAVIQERKGDIYDPLARWASAQRQNYRRHQTGKHTTLSEEKNQEA